MDRAGTYQDKGFGVPGLGLKRGLEEDLVVAPVRDRARQSHRSGGGRCQSQGACGRRGVRTIWLL